MKEAVILAAGEGERMFPYNETKPKAAIPVANTPVIKTMVNNLKQSGVERIWVVVGHLKEQIKALLGEEKGVTFIEQGRPQGTLDSLKLALSGLSSDFFVLCGDLITPKENLIILRDEFLKRKVTAAVLLDRLGGRRSQDWVCGGLDSKGRLSGIYGHPRGGSHRLCGIYAFKRKEIGSYLERNPGFVKNVSVGGMPKMEPELAQSLQVILDDGREVAAVETSEFLVDLDKPWHILEANEKMLKYIFRGMSGRRIAKSAKVSSDTSFNGKVIIGERSEIGPRVVFQGNVIVGNNTKVLNGAIVGGDTIIGDNCAIYNYCQVSPGTSIGNKSKVGHTAEVGGVIMEGVYLLHYCEFSGVIGNSVDIGAATVCGGLRFDDNDQVHRIKGRRETPEVGANETYIGDYCRTGVNVIFMPGVKVGSYSVIGPGVIVSKDVPARSMLLLKQEIVEKEWGPQIYGW